MYDCNTTLKCVIAFNITGSILKKNTLDSKLCYHTLEIVMRVEAQSISCVCKTHFYDYQKKIVFETTHMSERMMPLNPKP